jgi:hypothetical protein
MKRQMTPNSTSFDSAHSLSADAIVKGDYSMQSHVCTDGENLVFSEWAATPVTALGIHVTQIVTLCPKEEMVRSDAWGIVTSMTDTHLVRDGSMGEFPCESVGIDGSACDPQDAVAVGCSSRRPLPTRVGPPDFLPEATFGRLVI